MKINILCRTRIVFAAPILILAILSACAKPSPPIAIVAAAPTKPAGSPAPEVIVYASDLTTEALDELDFIEDVASPGGVMIGLPNSGDELDPPPESDPHVTFAVPVERGVPYRCWIHMKVGEAKGRSTANTVYVQFSKSVDEANQEVFRLSTNSYLTAQGPTQPGWTWVSCDLEDGSSLIYFENSGESRVRIQAGAEGVGFDQFLLSPATFLEAPPPEAVLPK
jgi:hypothetical protein